MDFTPFPVSSTAGITEVLDGRTRRVSHLIDLEGRRFVIGFPYDSRLVANVRRLPGRKYDSTRRTWSIAARWRNVGPLRAFAAAHGFAFTDAADSELTRLESIRAEKLANLHETSKHWTMTAERVDRALASFASIERREHWRARRAS